MRYKKLGDDHRKLMRLLKRVPGVKKHLKSDEVREFKKRGKGGD
jgi:hypothetical protein